MQGIFFFKIKGRSRRERELIEKWPKKTMTNQPAKQDIQKYKIQKSHRNLDAWVLDLARFVLVEGGSYFKVFSGVLSTCLFSRLFFFNSLTVHLSLGW